mgnify:FL=1
MDESTPHLHLNLIPVIDGRLCGKRLFDRKALHNLQTELYEVVGKKWNLQRGKEGSQAKHLSTAEFKAKKIVEQAHGEADALKANAERKVKIAQIHAEGIIASAEQSAVEAKQQAQEYLDGVIRSVEEEKIKPTPKRKRQVEEELSVLRTENAALRKPKKSVIKTAPIYSSSCRKLNGEPKAKNKLSEWWVTCLPPIQTSSMPCWTSQGQRKLSLRSSQSATIAAESNNGIKNLTASQVSRQENIWRTGIERAAAAEL